MISDSYIHKVKNGKSTIIEADADLGFVLTQTNAAGVQTTKSFDTSVVFGGSGAAGATPAQVTQLNTATSDIALKENSANKDTDPLLVANSDIKYPSQKAIKMYIDSKIQSYTKPLAIEMGLAGNVISGNNYTVFDNQLANINHKVQWYVSYGSLKSPNSSSPADNMYGLTIDDWTNQNIGNVITTFKKKAYVFLQMEMSGASTGVLPEINAGLADTAITFIATKYIKEIQAGLIAFAPMHEFNQNNTDPSAYNWNLANTRTANGANIAARISNFKTAWNRVAAIFYNITGVACCDLVYAANAYWQAGFNDNDYALLKDCIPNQKYIRMLGCTAHSRSGMASSPADKNYSASSHMIQVYENIKNYWSGGFIAAETSCNLAGNTIEENAQMYSEQAKILDFIPSLAHWNDFLTDKSGVGDVNSYFTATDKAVNAKFLESRQAMVSAHTRTDKATNIFNFATATVTGTANNIAVSATEKTINSSNSTNFYRCPHNGTAGAASSKEIGLVLPAGVIQQSQEYTLIIPMRARNATGTYNNAASISILGQEQGGSYSTPEDLRQIKQLNAGWENIVFTYINFTSSTLSNDHKIIFQIGFNNTAFDLDVDWQAMKMFKGIAKD